MGFSLQYFHFHLKQKNYYEIFTSEGYLGVATEMGDMTISKKHQSIEVTVTPNCGLTTLWFIVRTNSHFLHTN